eukprot:GFUD01016419.1.p1 GENE.GFUD01016419.1~~GFUD01016419.1.p1  ORF type:complete len:109 (-),score=43.17 GFUD01016419.1:45-371(-)
MSESFQALLSSWAKDPSGSMKEISNNITESFKTAKTPLDLLIDYHNFWSKAAGLNNLVVDKNQEMTMERLSEAFAKVAEEMKNSNMTQVTQMWEAMAAWRERETQRRK